MRAPRRHRLSLVLLLVLATGCGSTIQTTSAIGGAVPSDDGLTTVPSGDGLGTTPLQGGARAASGITGGTVGAGSTGGATGASVPGTTGGTVAPSGVGGASGPGVTDKVVYVGVVHDTNSDSVNNAAGVGSVTHGDSLANARAVVDDINKHGGVAGRRIELVTANFDTTSTQTLDQQWAAVCQKFTRDSPRVFAVLDATRDSYVDCTSKAGVVTLSDNLPTFGEEEFRTHPSLLELGYPNVDRLARYQITSLVEQHYFTPWDSVSGQPAPAGVVKVGVLTYSDKIFSHAVDTYLVPELKRLGYDPVVEKIAPIGTASDIGAQAAAVKSAQLAFAANGVTHVIPFESNGGLSTFFLPTARGQGYYPRYGISSASGFEALREAGVADNRQFNGAVGFGWIPSLDLQASDLPESSPYSGPARSHCRQVMRDHGITPNSGNAEALELSTCASFYLLKAAGDLTPARLNVATIMAAVESLGASYRAAGALGEEFRPGRHDAPNSAYHWRYVAACTCFRYEGPLRTLP